MTRRGSVNAVFSPDVKDFIGKNIMSNLALQSIVRNGSIQIENISIMKKSIGKQSDHNKSDVKKMEKKESVKIIKKASVNSLSQMIADAEKISSDVKDSISVIRYFKRLLKD